MENRPIMSDDEAWSGGHYELLLDVGGGTPVPGLVAEVSAALWTHPDLDGPCPSRDLEPPEQIQLKKVPGQGRHCYGVATTPTGVRVACGMYETSSVPEFQPDGEPYPPDVVNLYLPLESLSRAWPTIGGFPFQPGQDTRPWQEPLDDWLAGIAAHVFARVGFRLAVTDFELDADYDEWRSWTPDTVPADRRVDLLLPAGDELRRFRRTHWA
jgi:hypothetical protein